MSMDQTLLEFINRDLSNPVFDLFFPFWTDFQKNPYVVFGLFPFTLVILLFKKNFKLIQTIAFALMVTWIASAFNGQFTKKHFMRERPKNVIYRVDPQKSFSFPSGHALSAFCMATMMGLFYKRYMWIFLGLAFLTAFSRVYCGVHFPGDVMAGAIVGSVWALAFSQFKRWLPISMILILPNVSFAYHDPTDGKAFFPWVWEDELKPTLKKSIDGTGVTILGTGAGASLITRVYDHKIYDYNRRTPILIGHKDAQQLGKVGNGLLGASLAAAQVLFDTPNGVKTVKAMLLTSTSHIGTAYLARRNRPDNRTDFLPFPSSFPSGHTSNAFALAGSMAYSYGWMAGIPAYAIATGIGVSRVRESRHWASDVVSGAFLGTFWARASFRTDDKEKETTMIVPSPVYDGMMITASREF